jgi:hypothetical protein
MFSDVRKPNHRGLWAVENSLHFEVATLIRKHFKFILLRVNEKQILMLF